MESDMTSDSKRRKQTCDLIDPAYQITLSRSKGIIIHCTQFNAIASIPMLQCLFRGASKDKIEVKTQVFNCKAPNYASSHQSCTPTGSPQERLSSSLVSSVLKEVGFIVWFSPAKLLCCWDRWNFMR